MNTVFKIVVTGAALLAAVLLMQGPSAAPRARDNAAASAAPVGATFRPCHGLSIQLHGTSETVPIYERLVDEVAALGADTVMFVSHGWQTHAGTADLHLDAAHSPSLADLARLCRRARSRGLRVVIMPVVLLSSPRNTEWRGQINPTAGWDEWFKRYTQFILEHARVCEAENVDLLMIGSELIKAEQYTDRWRQLIAEVRQFYRGKLGYSANWDHYTTDKIGFWPQLDCVGMTSYYTLASGPRPTLEEVLGRWAPIKQRILKFAAQVRKPIIFTEAGWCSQEGAAYESWNYYHNQKATVAGHQEQATCYRAFMQTWENTPEVAGTLWWEWTGEEGGPNNFNYTPKGKPAERLLREWFARQRVNRGNSPDSARGN